MIKIIKIQTTENKLVIEIEADKNIEYIQKGILNVLETWSK